MHGYSRYKRKYTLLRYLLCGSSARENQIPTSRFFARKQQFKLNICGNVIKSINCETVNFAHMYNVHKVPLLT